VHHALPGRKVHDMPVHRQRAAEAGMQLPPDQWEWLHHLTLGRGTEEMTLKSLIKLLHKHNQKIR